MEPFFIKALIALIVLALLIWALQVMPIIDATVKSLIMVLLIVCTAVFIARAGGLI